MVLKHACMRPFNNIAAIVRTIMLCERASEEGVMLLCTC